MPAYTDADVQAASDSVAHKEILDPPFRALSGLMSYDEVEAIARAVLDAVAPAIAARALREAAWEWESLVQREKPPVRGSSWLARRADEIERTP